MELKKEHFKCKKEKNSKKRDKREWESSNVVIDYFCEYLKKKGLKKDIAGEQAERVQFFVMKYLFVYDDAESVLDVSGDAIRTFLGNWYIRKFLNPKMSEIKVYLSALFVFFTFLQEEGFISEEELKEIQEACKDIPWFEMRLRTYFDVDGDDFYEWVREYDYDL
jgi:hypothetical protein